MLRPLSYTMDTRPGPTTTARRNNAIGSASRPGRWPAGEARRASDRRRQIRWRRGHSTYVASMSSWLLHNASGHRSSWKRRSWAARALSSCSLPPLGLLAFFAIVVFFLAVSGYVDYKAIERRAEIGARVFAAPLALAAAFLLFAALSWRRRYWTTRSWRRRAHYLTPTPTTQAAASSSSPPPWGVAVAVAILLLMVSFQPSVHSMWFRPLWDSSDY
ncbi:hypothetical protein BS78_01G003400 [Paspalum vaginatum]|nr:hypothetical protein BS78_01G003400 [Paspalum vaginatum]